jgi:hypothetical protein
MYSFWHKLDWATCCAVFKQTNLATLMQMQNCQTIYVPKTKADLFALFTVCQCRIEKRTKNATLVSLQPSRLFLSRYEHVTFS